MLINAGTNGFIKIISACTWGMDFDYPVWCTIASFFIIIF